MPRTTDPRLVENGLIVEARRRFSEEELTEIRTLNERTFCKAEVAELDAVLASAVDILQRYWRWKHNGPSAFNRAEAAASLNWCLTNRSFSWGGIQLMNPRAQELIIHELWMMPLDEEEKSPTVFRALLDGRVHPKSIEKAAIAALTKLNKTRGPDVRSAVDQVVQELCEVYECATGIPVTLSNKGKLLKYEETPRSSAGEWVCSVVRSLDRDVRPSQVSHSLRKCIGLRNSQQKQ